MSTRELSFAYGGFTVGGSSGREITGIMRREKRFKEVVFEVTFDIGKTTQATFDTEVAAVEDAFRKPYQNLILTTGSTTETYSQSANTWLEPIPEIIKQEENASGRSRRYTVRIVAGLPANTGGETVTGLQEHAVDVAYDGARIRTISITGTFTAVTSNDARAQYEAQIASLESSIFTALSIAAANRELVEEPQGEQSYNNKTIQFRRVWRELVFSQGGSTLNDSGLVKQEFRVHRKRMAPGDTATNTKRLVEISVEYFAIVDATVTTDLKAKYNAIRGWIIAQAVATQGGGSAALVDETFTPNFDLNTITVGMTIFMTSGSNIIEDELSTEDYFEFGGVLVPAWTGNSMSKYRYQGPAKRIRTITHKWKNVGSAGSSISNSIGQQANVLGSPFLSQSAGAGALQTLTANTAAGISNPQAAQGAGMLHVSTRKKSIPKTMGLDGYKFVVTENEQTDLFEFYAPI